MPELPEVEAVTRLLRRDAIGAVIQKTEVFRPRAIRPQTPADFRIVQGASIVRVKRVGKHIVLWLTSKSPRDLALKAHLGMTGNFHIIPDARLHTAHVRVLFTLEDGRGLAMEDARIFGSVQVHTAAELPAHLDRIGIDPLSKAFTAQILLDAATRSKKPAKVLLMDQFPISGLGNIYAAEALYRAGINPFLPLSAAGKRKLVALHAAIPAVLKDAIRHTLRSYRSPGFYEDMGYDVYGRNGEPCRICKQAVQKSKQAGRSTYYCPGCQTGLIR